MNDLKQRHGCVTSWLWFVILANLVMAIFNFVTMYEAYTAKMSLGLGLLGIIGIVNILSAILLMRWNKLGFYMFLVGSFVSIIVGIVLLELPSTEVVPSLIAVFIWLAILQIRKNGISVWNLMSCGWDYKHCRHLYQVFIGVIVVMFILAVFASLSDHEGNPYEKVLEEYDNTEIDIEPIDKEKDTDVLDIDWHIFEDSTRSVRIKAPSEFREVKFNEDQLISLCCSDFDPVIGIFKESKPQLNAMGVNTAKGYAQLVLNMIENSGGSNYRKISNESLEEEDNIKAPKDEYVVECEIVSDGICIYYKIKTVKTDNYFYSCQIFCDNSYRLKLQPQIDRMISSFEALK